ncbi:hypothetical protein LCGC14_2638840 [marine sediment metagenome]|uniref:Uncharacterized protein n=1 Tax=marine sediment metagenome TaxID=412755 RepID=A0A0F9AKK8_9ZZZZ
MKGSVNYNTGKFDFPGEDIFLSVGRKRYPATTMPSDHRCPVCGGKTYLEDADQYGCVRVRCLKDGPFTFQLG